MKSRSESPSTDRMRRRRAEKEESCGYQAGDTPHFAGSRAVDRAEKPGTVVCVDENPDDYQVVGRVVRHGGGAVNHRERATALSRYSLIAEAAEAPLIGANGVRWYASCRP